MTSLTTSDTLIGKPGVDGKKVLQHLLYGLKILSTKSESNRVLCLASISTSLTLAQKLQTEKIFNFGTTK